MRLKFYRVFLTVSLPILFFLHCAGGRATIRFNKLEYPVSTTAYVVIDGKEIIRDEKTRAVGTFEIKKRFWGIVYSFVSLSDGDEMIERLNHEVTSKKGKAVTNFRIENEACAINAIPLLSALPILPGCTIVTFKGEVIRP